jgi:threonine dehydratase
MRLSAQDQLTFVHAFDDDAVIAGQGTLGLELLEQHPLLEAVIVPVGGGGLIGGLGCALKETHPGIQIIGVQPSRLPSAKVALSEGKPVTLPSAVTIADGIAVRRAGERTLPLIQKYVDEIVTVEEEEIANAVLLLLEREKVLAEGAGAAALAALVNRRIPLIFGSSSRDSKARDKQVIVIVSGGNIDVTLLARIIERGLVKDGRLVRLRVHLPDYPGALHRLTGILAEHRANIVETSYDRAYHNVNLGDTAIDITMETRGPEHIAELISAVGANGYTHERIL